MLELRIIAAGRPTPLFNLPAIVGRREAYREIGNQVDALIAFLDDLGGDPDLEPCGAGEDLGTDIQATAKMGFAGDDPQLDDCREIDDDDCCSARDDDPGYYASDGDPGDPVDGERAYVEWHTKSANSRRHGGYEACGNHEDDEEDDPREANGDEHDTGNAEDDELALSVQLLPWMTQLRGPGCPISDPDFVDDDREAIDEREDDRDPNF